MLRSSAVIALAVAPAALAAPQTLLHQGRVLDPVGQPLQDTRTVTIGLYTSPTGGSPVWSESESIRFEDGYYAVVMGDQAPLDGLDFAATDLWVGLSVGGAALGPRTAIRAVPVAMSVVGQVDVDTPWLVNGAVVSYAGGPVGVGTDNPHASAALEVASATGGLLPPRLTLAQRDGIPSPAAGLVIFNTSTGDLELFNGTGWVRLGATDPRTELAGGLQAWGMNTAGELGQGNTTQSAYPRDIALPGAVIAIDSGGYANAPDGATCAILANRNLYCWGRGAHVPDGTGNNALSPVRVGTGLQWRSVHVGNGLASCGVTTSDEAWCWGYQSYGALGNGVNSGTYVYAPQEVIGGIPWKTLVPGGRYNGSFHFAFLCGVSTAATGANGYCWGRDDYGVLGDGGGTSDHNYTTPANGRLATHRWRHIEPGYYHVCGIREDDVAMCWGNNGQGRLGNGNTTQQTSPVVVAGGHRWKQLGLGEQFTCGLRTDGVAMCWGDNGYGQLGDGTTTDRSTPGEVIGNKRWERLTVGQHHACALDTTGAAYCWGYNGQGGLGNGSTTNVDVPTRVFGEVLFADITAGTRHTTGLLR